MTWKGHGRQQLWPKLWYYSSIHLEGLSKITKRKTSVMVEKLRKEFEVRTDEM